MRLASSRQTRRVVCSVPSVAIRQNCDCSTASPAEIKLLFVGDVIQVIHDALTAATRWDDDATRFTTVTAAAADRSPDTRRLAYSQWPMNDVRLRKKNARNRRGKCTISFVDYDVSGVFSLGCWLGACNGTRANCFARVQLRLVRAKQSSELW